VYDSVEQVMKTYSGLNDAEGVALITEETWKVHRNQRRLVVDLNALGGE
jgi:hypothetical protein